MSKKLEIAKRVNDIDTSQCACCGRILDKGVCPQMGCVSKSPYRMGHQFKFADYPIINANLAP